MQSDQWNCDGERRHHSVAIDDGTNSGYAAGGAGGFPVIQADALDREPQSKGGPYSRGVFPGGGQFGTLHVAADGDPTVTVTLRGLDWRRRELTSLRVTMPARPKRMDRTTRRERGAAKSPSHAAGRRSRLVNSVGHGSPQNPLFIRDRAGVTTLPYTGQSARSSTPNQAPHRTLVVSSSGDEATCDTWEDASSFTFVCQARQGERNRASRGIRRRPPRGR